jgi:hypothetical protein
MESVRDYTIKNGLGIRVYGRRACQVIRYQKKQWIEIGREYEIPVEKNILAWTDSGIPASILAVALRVYELDHPESDLRQVLTRRAPIWRAQRPAEPVEAAIR